MHSHYRSLESRKGIRNPYRKEEKKEEKLGTAYQDTVDVIKFQYRDWFQARQGGDAFHRTHNSDHQKTGPTSPVMYAGLTTNFLHL